MADSTAAIWMIIILFGFPYVAVALFCIAAAIDWIIEDRKERKAKAIKDDMDSNKEGVNKHS